jgi:[ribosomal protein S5]-alanine N-acetyltransferase
MTLLSAADHIETERLLLRLMNEGDLDFLIGMHGDADVARYIGSGNPRSPAETEQWLADVLESYRRAQLGPLVAIRKADGIRVGRSGLSDAIVEVTAEPGALRRMWFFSHLAPDGVAVEKQPELGYTFAREHWGQGYASEAARAVRDYALAHLSHPVVMSVIHAENRASQAVARKFGAAYLDDLFMAGRVYGRYIWPGFSRT